MAAPGTSDSLGTSTMSKQAAFESPANPGGGSRFDMGMLALFLVSNWFVNGETVLIDGGVSRYHLLFVVTWRLTVFETDHASPPFCLLIIIFYETRYDYLKERELNDKEIPLVIRMFLGQILDFILHSSKSNYLPW